MSKDEAGKLPKLPPPPSTVHTQASTSASNMDEVFKVGVRIPPFWPERPAVWFAQIEGAFALSGINTDSTKFYYVISQLDQQIAAEVEDIIVSPPENDKYMKIKSEIIKRLSASQEKKVKQLLIHEELGDRKPSQFLRHLQTLAGPNIPAEFLRTLWASRLPNNIQTVIATQTSLALDALADIADKVHEIAPSTPQIAMASTSFGSSCSPNTIDELAKQMASLTRQVSALTTHFNRSQNRQNRQSRNSSRSQSRGRHPSRERSSSGNRGRLCWYHYKFGPKAAKCMKPCNFDAGNDAGSH